MKTQIRCAPHGVLPGEHIIEIWHDGEFIGQVTGADGPGILVMSKYPLTATQDNSGHKANIIEVHVGLPEIRDYPTFRDFVQEHGFVDENDFHLWVSNLDISKPDVFMAFTVWKHGDGTKAGLLAFYERFKITLPGGRVSTRPNEPGRSASPGDETGSD